MTTTTATTTTAQTEPTTSAASEAADRTPRRLVGLLLPVGLSALVFAAVAPTLSWPEFVDGGEDTVVATALGMERGGPVWVPQLHHQDRTRKPPLAAWVAAAGIRSGTVAQLESTDQQTRDAAFTRLAWESRRTALASMCLMLLAVYGLGRVVGGRQLGLASAAVCGSSVMFLRYCRWATTDVQLALWVSAANLFFARAMFGEGRRWTNCLLGGAMLGMAFMSKGPVGLVQSALPLLAFAGWRRWASKTESPLPRPEPRGFEVVGMPPMAPTTSPPSVTAEGAPPGGGSWRGPLIGASAVMLAIGLPWYLTVLFRNRGILSTWFAEVTREGAIESAPDPWFNYLAIVPFLFPWVLFLAVGLAGSFALFWGRPRDRRGRIVLGLLLLVLPVLVMSFFKDRKTRYLLPMVGPAAVVAAWGLLDLVRTRPRRNRLLVLHWALLAAAAVGVIVAGAAGLREALRATTDGRPWFPWPIAAAMAAAVLGVIYVGARIERQSAGGPRAAAAVVAATALVALGGQFAFYFGFASGPLGHSRMKPLADAIWSARPGAAVYSCRGDNPIRNVPRDLEIYLSRPVTRVMRVREVPRGEPDGRPQVLVVAVLTGQRWRHPRGWNPISSVRDQKREWFAYWRDP